jgi:hypothetical protein
MEVQFFFYGFYANMISMFWILAFQTPPPIYFLCFAQSSVLPLPSYPILVFLCSWTDCVLGLVMSELWGAGWACFENSFCWHMNSMYAGNQTRI